MKKYSILFCLFLQIALAFAQAPEKMSYQAVVRNNNNVLVSNHSVGMRISILQGSATGTTVYTETQIPTTNANGLIAIEIGTGTVVSGTFSNIDWANGPYFVKTETDPNGGTAYTLTASNQLLSVPYALYAKTAGNGCKNKHYIGEYFGGGIVFYVWSDSLGVEHGLITDKTDLSTNANWSNIQNSNVGILAQSLWDGLGNSVAIVNQNGHLTSAAKLCLDLVSGGQNDWYLPSYWELNILFNNSYVINKVLIQINGSTLISSKPYWSSTESNTGAIRVIDFGSGDNYCCFGKNGSNCVRAIRSF